MHTNYVVQLRTEKEEEKNESLKNSFIGNLPILMNNLRISSDYIQLFAEWGNGEDNEEEAHFVWQNDTNGHDCNDDYFLSRVSSFIHSSPFCSILFIACS